MTIARELTMPRFLVFMTLLLFLTPLTGCTADEEELAGVRRNMEKLIQQKLEMFPNDLRQIVGARIFKSGDKDRIEIMSARVG